MNQSYSISDLQNLLQQWWTAAPQVPANDAASTEASLDSDADPSVAAASRRLQQAEVLMANLPSDQVASCVLELLASAPADENSVVSHQQKQAGLGTAWYQAAKQHWAARRRQWDQTLDNTPASETPDTESSPVLDQETNVNSWYDQFSKLYESMDKDSALTCQLLGVLAWQDAPGLQKLAQLLVQSPPTNSEYISTIFSPLVYRDDLPADALFPEVLAAMSQLPLATAVLDLSNYLYRERQVRPHVATQRKTELAGLLASVTQRLLKIEEDPAAAAVDASQLSQIVNDSVGLIAALCDALALIGDNQLVGKIYPAMEVKHRRVQLEAANALATLGEEDAKKQLIEMASQPVVRRRVLAYCEQLGCLDQVDKKFQTDAAAAESEMALWLSHPSNMGLAPFEVKVVDQRTQYWPGYDDPIPCFLLRYSYPFEDNNFENLGLVGPITHAFATPLADLPADDVYAVFAGWQVQHPEIYTIDRSDAGPLQLGSIARLERRLHDEGFEVQQAHLLGHCLGDWSMIARAKRDDREGWAATDQESCVWLPDDAGFAGFDATTAWYLYLGRKLLTQFNTPSPPQG